MMTLVDVACRLGVSVISARQYHNRATRRRREGCPLFGDMPAPDVVVGRSPRWYVSTIEGWVAQRPGRGARPKKLF